MKIVIDSNIFIADFGFNSPNWKVLSEYATEFENVRICIPQVVLDEVSYHYKSRIDEINATISKVKKSLRTIGEGNINFTLIDDKEYVQLFKKNIVCDILPYPTNMLEELIQRTIKRIKPAKPDGKDVRDTLIWLQIKELANDDDNKEVIFVTDNKADFCANDPKSLSNDLIQESAGLNIKIYSSLKCVVEEYITPLLKDYSSPELTLSKLYDEIAGFDFADIVCDDISNYDIADYIESNYGYSGCRGLDNICNDENNIESYTITPMLDAKVVVNLSIKGSCVATPYIIGYYDDTIHMDEINIEYVISMAIEIKDGENSNITIEEINYEI